MRRWTRERTSIRITGGIRLPHSEATGDPLVDDDARVDGPHQRVRVQGADGAACASGAAVEVLGYLDVEVVLVRVAVADADGVFEAAGYWVDVDGGGTVSRWEGGDLMDGCEAGEGDQVGFFEGLVGSG